MFRLTHAHMYLSHAMQISHLHLDSYADTNPKSLRLVRCLGMLSVPTSGDNTLTGTPTDRRSIDRSLTLEESKGTHA